MQKLTQPVTDLDHSQGPAAAPVTIVEYGDYQCPYTRKASLNMARVMRRSGDRLRFVFRNFPLSHIHPNAQSAAEAAEAAAAQDKFWDMHARLFENQQKLDDPNLAHYAADLDLDRARFDQEMADRTHAARVLEDFDSGTRSGVSQTPTFFINGVLYTGSYSSGVLIDVIEEQAHVR